MSQNCKIGALSELMRQLSSFNATSSQDLRKISNYTPPIGANSHSPLQDMVVLRKSCQYPMKAIFYAPMVATCSGHLFCIAVRRASPLGGDISANLNRKA